MSITKKINLHHDEEIILINKHFFLSYSFYYFLGFVFLAVASFFMTLLISYEPWGYAVYGLAMIIGLYIIFKAWFFSNKNFLIITSRRIVNIDRIGWFDEIMSTLDFTDVGDLQIRKAGIWANLFNYGNISVATALDKPAFNFNHIRYPQKIADLILEYKKQINNNRKIENRGAVYSSFVKLIPTLPEEELCEIQDLVNEQLQIIDDEKE